MSRHDGADRVTSITGPDDLGRAKPPEEPAPEPV